MVNKVTLIGNLGADPESRTTPSGTTITNIRLATTSRRKDRDGNWTDVTDWHRVVCFGRTGENVARYLKKGSKAYVDGRISYSKYTDRDGNERWSTDIIANDVRFLDSRGGGGGGDVTSNDYPSTDSGDTTGGYQAGGTPQGAADDDIPF